MQIATLELFILTSSALAFSTGLAYSKEANDATVYNYPFVTMALKMREQVNNVGGFNKINVAPSLASPTETQIPSPNSDTLYVSAWLDLNQGPVVFNAPAIPDRFYIWEFMDFSTNVITSFSPRTHPSNEALSAVFQKNGDSVTGSANQKVVSSYSRYVWLVGRILVSNASDVENAISIGKELTLQSFNSSVTLNTSPNLPAPLPFAGTDVPDQNFADFLSIANWTYQYVPPNDSLYQTFAGLETHANDPAVKEAFKAALFAIDHNLQGITNISRWATCLKIGDFGNNLLLRATVAKKFLGGNLAVDALYLVQNLDSGLRILDGKSSYSFNMTQRIPANGFWSLAAYNDSHFFEQNAYDRYSVGTGTAGMVKNSDGGAVLYLSVTPPTDPALFNNWLPVTKGNFSLILRAYWPDQQLLDGSYAIPAVVKQ